MGFDFGVGREAPQFTLTSHDGNVITLKQYRGDWFAVLVFYADDLDGAAENVAGLSDAGADLWGFHGQVVGLVHGSLDGARELAGKAAKVGFPLVADEDGGVARAYGAGNAAKGTRRNLAVIVDRSGKIVWSAEGGATPLEPAAIVAGLRDVAR